MPVETKKVECPKCEGHGAIWVTSTSQEECPLCEGSGRLVIVRPNIGAEYSGGGDGAT